MAIFQPFFHHVFEFTGNLITANLVVPVQNPIVVRDFVPVVILFNVVVLNLHFDTVHAKLVYGQGLMVWLVMVKLGSSSLAQG